MTNDFDVLEQLLKERDIINNYIKTYLKDKFKSWLLDNIQSLNITAKAGWCDGEIFVVIDMDNYSEIDFSGIDDKFEFCEGLFCHISSNKLGDRIYLQFNYGEGTYLPKDLEHIFRANQAIDNLYAQREVN